MSERKSQKKRRKRIKIMVKTMYVLLLLTLILGVTGHIVQKRTQGTDREKTSSEREKVSLQDEDDGYREGSVEDKTVEELSGEKGEDVRIREDIGPSEEAEEAFAEETEGEEEQDRQPDTTEEKADQILENMTLHEKICQMLLVTPETLTGVGTVTAAGETTRKSLEANPVGGVILFENNITDREQTTQMLANLKAYMRQINGVEPFIAVDEEGGRVARVAKKLGTSSLSPMYTYREEGTQKAYENAAIIGRDIADIGFNLDFAPVADTWSNPSNKVIGERAYSDDFGQASELVAAAVEGFHSANMICTLKHFPGHGDTAEDSHAGSAYCNKTLEQLWAEELRPFQAGIRAGADMIMTGHITLPEIDSLPASLSEKVIGNLLRQKLEYDGVVITDSLSMKALTDLYGFDKIAVMAVKAGNDLLLCQNGMSTMISALENAVNSGEITEERINESVRRILALKEKYGMLER